MIKIERTYPAPIRLLEHGAEQTRLDCDAYDQSPGEFISGKSFPDKDYYSARDVKDSLLEMHHWKCCYCETRKYERGELQVEHFRPKGRVRQSTGEKEEYPGYYWLKYSWENLLLSCQACNNKKGTKFPLRNPGQRARSHHDEWGVEDALLINPTEEDPRSHIDFDGDAPRALTEDGRETIRELDLRRAGLTEHRLSHREAILAHLVMLMGKFPTDLQGYQQEAERYLRRFLQRDEQFSSMVMDLARGAGILFGNAEQSNS